MAERDKKITELDNGGFVADGLFIADDIDQNDSLITQSHLISEIGEKTMDDFQYATAGFNTTDKTPVGAINEIQPSLGVMLTDTLEAGDTSLTLTDSAITTNSSYDYYGLYPTSVTISTGQMVLTFEAQEFDVEVKVVIF